MIYVLGCGNNKLWKTVPTFAYM